MSNDEVIQAFKRLGKGIRGGQKPEGPTLLLRHRGRVSGKEHVTPLAYQVYGDHYVVATISGAQPDWYRNLLAHPEATVEVGGQAFPVSARVTEGAEREKLRAWRIDDPVLSPALRERELASAEVAFVVLDRTDAVDRKKALNREVVAEYRRTGGRINRTVEGVPMAGLRLLLLHHRGRTSGRDYVTPLAYQPVNGAYLVVATNGGSAEDPQWYRNLQADPVTVIEVGSTVINVRARVLEGAERRAFAPDEPARRPQRAGRFGAYDQFVTRRIPLVALEPTD